MNKIKELRDSLPTSNYAAIIGANPSRGARSPLLWNAAFQGLGIDARMIALDLGEMELPLALSFLELDNNFIGGAVAAPYKEIIAKFIPDRLTTEAMQIGSVNCLFRRGGQLHGTNTDGEACVDRLESAAGSVEASRVLVLGAGGTGKSVAAFFAKKILDLRHLTITSRSDAGLTLSKKLGCNWIPWNVIDQILPSVDILVNCTSVGSAPAQDSPVSRAQLRLLRHGALVYDVIYNPPETKLLKDARSVGLRVMNGSAMNLGQAVFGFSYATGLRNNKASIERVETLMALVLSKC
jgi:shikimate dehydrogenase